MAQLPIAASEHKRTMSENSQGVREMRTSKPDPALRRLLDSVAAEEPPKPQASQSGPVTVTRALVGQVNGEVIILGNVPANALEIVLGRGRRAAM